MVEAAAAADHGSGKCGGYDEENALVNPAV
jgi:hypothetical protein